MNARQKRKYTRNFILGARKQIEEVFACILMNVDSGAHPEKFWKRLKHAGLIERRNNQTTVTQKGLDLLSRRLYP